MYRDTYLDYMTLSYSVEKKNTREEKYIDDKHNMSIILTYREEFHCEVRDW